MLPFPGKVRNKAGETTCGARATIKLKMRTRNRPHMAGIANVLETAAKRVAFPSVFPKTAPLSERDLLVENASAM